ncbi:hypothetical protein LEN26_020971 [Aphanomyces euteiches]|nr:hypothetical protein LEN26_020971 [Aphanomyces euteiches]
METATQRRRRHERHQCSAAIKHMKTVSTVDLMTAMTSHKGTTTDLITTTGATLTTRTMAVVAAVEAAAVAGLNRVKTTAAAANTHPLVEATATHGHLNMGGEICHLKQPVAKMQFNTVVGSYQLFLKPDKTAWQLRLMSRKLMLKKRRHKTLMQHSPRQSKSLILFHRKLLLSLNRLKPCNLLMRKRRLKLKRLVKHKSRSMHRKLILVGLRVGSIFFGSLEII